MILCSLFHEPDLSVTDNIRYKKTEIKTYQGLYNVHIEKERDETHDFKKNNAGYIVRID